MGQVTIEGQIFEVYGTQAEALKVMIGSISPQALAFRTATADTQARAMVTAASLLDVQPWIGYLTDPVTPQPLAWPRTDAEDPMDPDGEYLDPTLIPRAIVRASYELAALLVVKPALANQSTAATSIESVSAGPVSVAFSTAAASSNTVGTRFPISVQELIEPYLDEPESRTVYGYAGQSTGVCAESSFNDSDRYTLT